MGRTWLVTECEHGNTGAHGVVTSFKPPFACDGGKWVPVEEPVYRIYGGSISATEPSREVRDWINEWLVKIGGDE